MEGLKQTSPIGEAEQSADDVGQGDVIVGLTSAAWSSSHRLALVTTGRLVTVNFQLQ
jgi:hypothetical protein